MLEFIHPTGVFLDHVQSRIELHGEEKVLAIDLSMHYTGSNLVLEDVAPGLRETLFTAHARQPGKRAQGEIDLPVDDLPHLRAPALVPPLRLDCELEGATVVVSNGIKAKTSIQLNLCKVHKVRVTAIEGGSTEVKFSVSCATGIDAQIVGTLSMKQQQEIELTMVGPKAEGQPAAAGDGEVLWPFPGSPDPGSPAAEFNKGKARKRKAAPKAKEAGEIFAEQHGAGA
jgi:hypothetical protein